MRFPINKPYRISCDYQCHIRKGGFTKRYAGTDIVSTPTVGAPVFAPEAGTLSNFREVVNVGGKAYTGFSSFLYSKDNKRRYSFAHLSAWTKTSGPISEGVQFAKTGYSGYTIPLGPKGAHLHYGTEVKRNGVWVRVDPNTIHKIPTKPILKKGDWVNFTKNTNIRKGNGLKYEVTGKAKKGDKKQIEGGPRRTDKYDWYDLVGDNWCIGNFMVKTTKPVPKPKPKPKPEPINWKKIAMEHEKQYKNLLDEIKKGKYILAENIAKDYILRTDVTTGYMAKATVKRDYISRVAYEEMGEANAKEVLRLRAEIKRVSKERRQVILKRCSLYELFSALLRRFRLDKLAKRKVDK